MDKELERRRKRSNLLIRILILVIIIGFIVAGSALIGTSGQQIETREQELDYTYCKKSAIPVTETCFEYLQTNSDRCECLHTFNLTISLVGDVIFYYTLDTLDQSKYAQSRDDNQLSGNLSTKVSPACAPADYTEEGKPIAPCGTLADAMFNDTYDFQWRRIGRKIVYNTLKDGMIKDKGIYRNPPGNESLEVLFQNYSKPINWTEKVWQNFTASRNSNGFEDERFIGWMDTNLKRKPAFRLNPILPELPDDDTPNLHTLQVAYNYPLKLYSGPRKVIIVATRVTRESSTAKYITGIVLLIIGIISLLAAIIVVAWRIRENRWQWY